MSERCQQLQTSSDVYCEQATMNISQVVRMLNSEMAAKYTDVASCTWGAQRGEGQAGWGWVSKEAHAPAGSIDIDTNLGAVTAPDDSAACRLMPLFG